ncbi:MAG: (Fe-S)-binding protein [Desulfobacterales bacterium]
MYELNYEPQICEQCKTCDCLVNCQYMDFDLAAAKVEKENILKGRDSKVLEKCVTCYACEEYCPNGNHPFYLIVERQEEKGLLPVPEPITKQQIIMMKPRGTISPAPVTSPVINMCYFPMLTGCIRGKLYEGASCIVGSDIFCNVMWLHFAKNSVIRERLPLMIDNIWNYYLRDSGVDELVCFHDECYGTFTQLAPAFGIEVPFKSIHLFEYLSKKLDELKDEIHPINAKVAYQRPCSNRLVPETQHWVDDIFQKIGAERVNRTYDRENALCCGQVFRAHQRDDLADDVQDRNLDDMQQAGADYCVFNCPACFFALSDAVTERGIMPILMSDLCQLAFKKIANGG